MKMSVVEEIKQQVQIEQEQQKRAYQVLQNEKSMPVKMWTNGVIVDDNSKQQLLQTAQMPFIYKWMAVMPDVHFGLGATIGSVIPTKGAIIPAAVGVDIGCGMMATRTNLTASDLPDNLHGLRTELERLIPHGMTKHVVAVIKVHGKLHLKWWIKLGLTWLQILS
jgi:tRNA-splicing ligase RtcB